MSARLRLRYRGSVAVIVFVKVWTFLGQAWAQDVRLSAPAPSDDARVPVRVVYDAPSGCPDAASFEAELHKRTFKARTAADSEPAHVFQVAIRRGASGMVVGRVATEWNGERSGVRELRGKGCSQVVSALALTAALAIDPDARLDLEPEAAKPLPAAVQPAPAHHPNQTVQSGSNPSPAHAPLEGRVGLDAGAARIITPRLMPTLGPFGELAWVGSGFVAPSVRLSLNLASNALDADRTASFTWLAGELELCPVAVHWGNVMALRPCAAGQGGAILAEGRTVPQKYSQARAWWSAGLSAHLSRRLSARFGVELFAGVLLPLRSRSFVFANPSREIARTATESGEVGIGAFAYLP